ncbi:MAG: hypothetical protein ACK40D_14585 [Cyanobacteriota bacterium]|jgi:hypothetical protein
MATAPPPHTRPRQVRQAAIVSPPRWRRWLLLGLCFGLGYGLTQRLLDVRWGEGSTKAPSFKPKSPPEGTTLEELRRREGSQPKPLAADLEELSRQQQKEKEKEAGAKREEAERQNAAREAEKERLESDRRRLEELSGSEQPTSPELPLPPPAAAPLPPPEPLPPEEPAAPTTQPRTEAPATTP